MGTHSSYQLRRLVVTLSEVSERDEVVVALHPPIRPLKKRSMLEPVPRCVRSTYSPLADDIATTPSVAVERIKSGV